ncbi:MAG TPA: VWA domain-containing protein [Vicinamibacterales bacterium]|nr:VWA domain-containing protein [Vicinamibacterales bacterium]
MLRTLTCLAAIAFVAVQNPAPQGQSFRSTSDVVPLFVTAIGKDGRLVTDLKREDFQIFDNGKPQPLTMFDTAPQPVRLIALVDISGSMIGRLTLLRAAAEELIRHLQPGDAIRAGTFGDDIRISPSFTRDPAALASWLPTDIKPNTQTPLWAAVDHAMGEFKDVSEGRRVVMVLSDGKDTGPLRSGQKILFGAKFQTQIEIRERAQRDDVMIYGVGVYASLAAAMQSGATTIGGVMSSTMPDPGLGTLAIDTGGGYIELRGRDDLVATFARIVDELHQQYLLGFVPPAQDGKTHKIEVKIARPDVRPRVRKNYVAPKR